MNKPTKLYDFLLKKNMNADSAEEQTRKLSEVQLFEFVREAASLLQENELIQPSLFTFTASSSMSGGPFPCAGLDCRLSKLNSLARFAAFYADHVYVPNPFERYLLYERLTASRREEIIGDIIGLWHARPLFEAGIFSTRNSIRTLCDSHLKEQLAIEKVVSEKLDHTLPILYKTYVPQVKVEICRENEEIFLRITGSQELIEHEVLDIVGRMPQIFIDKLGKASSRKLSDREVERYGCLAPIFLPIAQDVFQQNLHSCQANYLTGRKVEFDLATSLVNSRSIAKANSTLVHGFSHALPNLLDVEVKNLVDLRKKEGEAFNVYRDKLRSALKESDKLSISEIQELVDDEIRPEIHKIEQTIKNSRRLLVGSLTKDLFVSSGFVTIGLFSGILSQQAGEIIAALGGISFAGSIVDKLTKLFSLHQEVQNNPYYFLWQANKQS